ncbi:MAG: 1-acyl-sn-glycerol-3-phosphate acyltransferase [Thermomicrobiales bacterium]
MPWRSLRAISRIMVKRNLSLVVEGADLLPRTGPVIVASRHYHHLYDGCALLATLDRPSHVLVAGDWAGNPASRMLLARACFAARWPVLMRPGGPSRITDAQAAGAFRTVIRNALNLFREGRILIVFPEGFPNVDPGYTLKTDDSMFLPFERGVVRLATIAARSGIEVPLVPVGFSYEKGDRWQVIMRFGSPIEVTSRDDEAAVLHQLETSVYALSAGSPAYREQS